ESEPGLEFRRVLFRSNEARAPEVEMTSSVEEVYNLGCASCHGEDLQGNTGPDISMIGSEYSKDEIKDIIVNGIGNMPGGMLEDDEDVELLTEYLTELK